jgi:iron complex outermembrane receptor protein
MKFNSMRGRLLASSIMGGVSLMAVFAAPAAYAQSAGDQTVEEIVVTGSRIRRVETTTSAPVSIIDVQEMSDRGFVQAGQLLNQATSNIPSNPIASGNGSAAGSGQTFANLFGLGAGRTLTLVNGRRFVTSPAPAVSLVSALGDQVVDTNIIPTGLLARVDVVQAGGAAVYGSDAIAGVVNYVMKDHFTGVEMDAQYGISSRDDFPQTSLRATVGKDFDGTRGNIAMDVEWSKTDPLMYSDRPRTNLARITATNPANTGPNDGVPSVTEIFDARFWEFNRNGLLFSPAPAPVPSFIFNKAGAPQQFNATGDALVPYNIGKTYGVPFAAGGDGESYRDLAALRTGVERLNLNAIGHYDLTEHLKLSGELVYAEVEGTDPYAVQVSNTVLNPAATGSGAIPILRSNPYLSPAVLAALGPGGPPLYLSKWFDDLLPTRQGTTTTDTLRALVSLDGDFDVGSHNFYWSTSLSHGETKGDTRNFGVWTSRFNNAVNAVRNGAGAIVCGINADAITSNDDAACAPLNPFGVGNISSAARNYVTLETGQRYYNTQDDFLATIGGDAFNLPAGAVKFSAAYEYRREEAKFTPYAAAQAGLVDSGVPSLSTHGQYHTNEFSGEILAPLLGGDFSLPFAKTVEFNGAYRRVDNSLAGKENVWSAGLRWEVVTGVTLRASRSRNFRAPSLTQLVAPSRTALSNVGFDPCDADRINSGPNPAVRLANCKAVWAANPSYGNLATFQDPAENFDQALVTTGGNPDLKNEVSKTTTFGIVLQPTFVPGLTIVADRIEVNMTNALSVFTPQNFSFTCFDSTTMPADVCSRFTRDATGAISTAQSTTFNAGQELFHGEVYNINYSFPIGRFFDDRDLGNLELSVEATHTDKRTTSVTGFDHNELAGTTLVPDWVTRFDARYGRGPLRVTYSMTYLPEAQINVFDTIESTPEPEIKRNIRHNISAQYDFGKYTVRGGITNVTDEQPSYPTLNYGDILGRQYFVGLHAKF